MTKKSPMKTAGEARSRGGRPRTAQERRCRTIAMVMDHLGEGVAVLDEKRRVVFVNPAFTAITGYALADVQRKKPPFIRNLMRAPDTYRDMSAAMSSGRRWEGDFYDVRKGGGSYAVRLSMAPIVRVKNGMHYVALLSDVTERKRVEEQTLHQAMFDELTGLPNRRLFLDRLAVEMERAARNEARLAVLWLDLDGFKDVNDTLGHNSGDALLKQAAQRIAAAVRSGDTVARLGGDEFTIIMPSRDDDVDPAQGSQNNAASDAASMVADRVLQVLSAPFDLGDESTGISVSASIGIAVFPDDGRDREELMRNADQAMYRAKDDGKATWHFYKPSLDMDVRERLAIRNGLSGALKRNELGLHFQPKIDLASNTMVGVEALLRWQSPELGAVSPARFVPVMEETGLVVDIGQWIIREACRQHLAWRADGLPAIRIAVNLSARQLRDPAFVDSFERILGECGVGAGDIEVEITESMVMDDRQRAASALQALREMGIKIAMDDFGTGYSSLSYLNTFPIDTIKIDRSFVTDMTDDDDRANLIKAIISMGHALDRLVVAEGVETQAQADLLRQYACAQVQGYLISRPLPADGLAAYVRANPGLFPALEILPASPSIIDQAHRRLMAH